MLYENFKEYLFFRDWRETLRRKYNIFNSYILQGVQAMVNSHELQPGETLVVDTTNTTVVVCVGASDDPLTVSDINDNYIATLDGGESITLPYNTGKYKVYYPATSVWNAIVFVVNYVAL